MKEEHPQVLEEPAVAYGISTRERVMASTVSVDEYFDELIEKVRELLAELCVLIAAKNIFSDQEKE